MIRFDKYKPVYEARRVRDMDSAFETFLAALRLFHDINHPDRFFEAKEPLPKRKMSIQL